MNSRLIFPLFLIPFISSNHSQEIISEFKKTGVNLCVNKDEYGNNNISFFLSEETLQTRKGFIQNVNILIEKLNLLHFSIYKNTTIPKTKFCIENKHNKLYLIKLKTLNTIFLRIKKQSTRTYNYVRKYTDDESTSYSS